MKRPMKWFVAIGIMACAMALAFWISFRSPKTITIGIATTLTGKWSTSGTCIRNGAILAAEKCNESGGINGHKIELLINDNKTDPDTALKVAQELIENDAAVIIGYFLSSLAVKVAPTLNETPVVLITPGASTTALSGLDDNVFRVNIDGRVQAWGLTKTTIETLNKKNIVLVCDMANAQYAISMQKEISEYASQFDGTITGIVEFTSSERFNCPEIARQIIDLHADALFVITSPIEGALICQHVRKLDPKMLFTLSPWTSSDPSFIESGGPSIDGCIFVFGMNQETEEYKRFKKAFEHRFNVTPTFGDQWGYECMSVAIAALKKTTDPTKVKEAIIAERHFDGLDGPFEINRFGDSRRTVYISQLKNGNPTLLHEFGPDEYEKVSQ